MPFMLRIRQGEGLSFLSELLSGGMARQISGSMSNLSGWFTRIPLITKNHNNKASKSGSAYLIGAGVGDIELLTIKAYKAIQTADVILVDALVNKDLYTYFPKNAEVIYVGKKCGQHSMKQAQICQLLLDKALQGNRVVRLKGGDPSIFGRLAEETHILLQHNISFAVIPGITAATGCAAYSGIPLTHRDCAQSVRFVTASLKDKDDEANWQMLAHEKDTLVFYMGLSKVAKISERLQNFGMRASMPIAIVDQGTLENQQVVCSTLKDVAHDMQQYTLTGPAVIIVGEVVNKRVNIDMTMLQQNEITHLA